MSTQAIDLSAILAHQPHPQPFQQPQYAAQQPQHQQHQVVAQTAEKPKKKAPTADQKREKAVLDILAGKDTFGLTYASLLLQLDQVSLEKLVSYVKAKYGIL